MKRLQPLMMLLVAVGISGCDPQSRGFSLPPGDAEQGEQVFLNMQCLSCHTMEGYERPENAEDLSVALGGEVKSIKTYGELVTSVIHPSHKLARGYDMSKIQTEQGQSVMPVYNDVMTVTELVDLVTFLESKYKLDVYDATDYSTRH